MAPAELRAWRAALRFTQRQAAAALGISFTTFRLYERGERFERDTEGDAHEVKIPRSIELAAAAIAAELPAIAEIMELRKRGFRMVAAKRKR